MKLVGRIGWALFGLYLLATYGCATAGSVVPRDNQELAVWTVWAEAFGRQDAPPRIRWLEGDQLNCTDPNSGRPGFTIVDMDLDTGEGPVRCREGYTMRPDLVQIAWHGEKSYTETPLSHEFAHVVLIRRGIYLNHHGRADFLELVERGNAALTARGL